MKKFLKSICFIIIFIILFVNITNLLKDKRVYFLYDTTRKVEGFYNEDRNSLDVVFIGSSHVFQGLNPAIFWDEFGIPSYIFGANEQPLWISYHYIKEVLKYQKPKAIVLDVLYTARDVNIKNNEKGKEGERYQKEGVNRINLDSLKLSKNKIAVIKASVPKDERISYIIELIKYNKKWKSINKDSFKYLNYKNKNPYKGYTPSFNKVHGLKTSSHPLNFSDKSLGYFNKIIELSKQENFNLVLIKTPYNLLEEAKKTYAKVADIAKENNIPFINYNNLINEINLKFETDSNPDCAHLNSFGAEKVSRHLAKYLIENYNLEDKRNNPDYSDWNECTKYYKQKVNNWELSQETDIYNYLDKLNNPNYIVILSAKDAFTSSLNEDILNKLKAIGVKSDIKDKYRWSYISVLDNNKPIYEKVENAPLEYKTKINDIKVEIISKGLNVGNNSSIKINGKEYSKNKRGLNIVVYDKLLQEVADSVSFDTHQGLASSR